MLLRVWSVEVGSDEYWCGMLDTCAFIYVKRVNEMHEKKRTLEKQRCLRKRGKRMHEKERGSRAEKR